jgi:hypothetical protein
MADFEIPSLSCLIAQVDELAADRMDLHFYVDRFKMDESGRLFLEPYLTKFLRHQCGRRCSSEASSFEKCPFWLRQG